MVALHLPSLFVVPKELQLQPILPLGAERLQLQPWERIAVVAAFRELHRQQVT